MNYNNLKQKMSMKAIKIGLEHRDVFQVMTNCKVKRIILGLMDAAEGREPRGITREILPTFRKLREQMETSSIGMHPDTSRCIGMHGNGNGNANAPVDEYKALMEEHESFWEESKALGEEYKELMGRLKTLKERRKALKERHNTLKERRKGIMDGNRNERALESIMGRLAEAAKSEDEECVNREKEIIGSKLNDREAFKPDNGGAVFTPEAWKVIDENWEALKDAMCKIKAEKEKSDDIPLSVLESIPLPVEAWAVLDKHFYELARLFHI